MRSRWGVVCAMVVVALLQARLARSGDPVGSAFTYQGQLRRDGVPVTDTCAFEFTLWTDPVDPLPAGQVARPLLFDGPDEIEVVNGLFSVRLDFGEGAFNGEDRWLEVAVRCSTSVDLELLWPRQPVTAAPFASFAKQAPWQGLIGIPPDIADGDNDTRLSEAQVENYITDDPINLANGTTLSGQPIATGFHTTDTNAATLCDGASVFLDGDGNCVPVDTTGSSFWHANGPSIYYNAGYVGIGTSSPIAHLDVNFAATNTSGLNLRNTTSNQRYVLQVNGSGLAGSGRAGNFEIWGTGSPGDRNVFTATPTGLVGIGTSTPNEMLTVAGRIESTSGGFVFPDGTVQSTAASSSSSPWNTNGSSIYYNSGNVGLGISAPGQKLSVAGRIESTSLGFKFPDGTTQTTAARWAPSGSNLWYTGGNVGIGTSSPNTALDIAGLARVKGDTWPTDGWGMELAYNRTVHRGFLQVYNRQTSTWGDLFLGFGNVGIGTMDFTTGGRLAVDNNAGVGIDAKGTTWAAHFKDANGSGEAWLAGDDGQGREYGIQAQGNKAGGLFYDNGVAEARVAYRAPEGDTYGVWAKGHQGARFEQAGSSDTYAHLAYSRDGIWGHGEDDGGYFYSTASGVRATIATSEGQSINSNGLKGFVQNHPIAKDKLINYACLEGDEVGTYTRGVARLLGGVCRVALGETFKWVTNPDIGLTAHLTSRGECEGLYVESLTTSEMVVRELRGGTSDVTFNYVVYGLRIGFEESSVVQEKDEEAYIPSLRSVHERYEKAPELRRYNALERFKVMRSAVGERSPLELEAAHALRDAVEVYDPAIHGAVRLEMERASDEDLSCVGVAERASEPGESDRAECAAAAAGDASAPPTVEGLYRLVAEKDAQIAELSDRLARLEQLLER